MCEDIGFTSRPSATSTKFIAGSTPRHQDRGGCAQCRQEGRQSKTPEAELRHDPADRNTDGTKQLIAINAQSRTTS